MLTNSIGGHEHALLRQRELAVNSPRVACGDQMSRARASGFVLQRRQHQTNDTFLGVCSQTDCILMASHLQKFPQQHIC